MKPKTDPNQNKERKRQNLDETVDGTKTEPSRVPKQ